MYKYVILSVLVAVSAAQFPLDTPEVAHAKAAHFAAVAEAQARSLGAPVFTPQVPVIPHSPTFAPAPVFAPAPIFAQAPAAPTWKVWDGVPAPIVVANGHVQDTAEVTAEKAKHFAQVADAAVRAASTGPEDDGQYRHDHSGDYISYAPAPIVPAPFVPSHVVPGVPLPYHHAPATAHVVHVAHGFVQDTPEVAALKAERVAALRSAGGTV